MANNHLPEAEALKDNPLMQAPKEIADLQTVLQISYINFDKLENTGQIVIDRRLENDVRRLFDTLKKEKFPIQSVIPVSDERIMWSDELSMEMNNSSGWNYRPIYGKDSDTELSYHAYGWAIDINPRQNPWIKDGLEAPEGAKYDPRKPGTLYEDHPAVLLLESLGWTWGGKWKNLKDYQHFEKNPTKP